MGLIIIPFVLMAALCWYMRGHLAVVRKPHNFYGEKTETQKNMPRGLLLLMLVVALVPILNIAIFVSSIIVLAVNIGDTVASKKRD